MRTCGLAWYGMLERALILPSLLRMLWTLAVMIYVNILEASKSA